MLRDDGSTVPDLRLLEKIQATMVAPTALSMGPGFAAHARPGDGHVPTGPTAVILGPRSGAQDPDRLDARTWTLVFAPQNQGDGAISPLPERVGGRGWGVAPLSQIPAQLEKGDLDQFGLAPLFSPPPSPSPLGRGGHPRRAPPHAPGFRIGPGGPSGMTNTPISGTPERRTRSPGQPWTPGSGFARPTPPPPPSDRPLKSR